MSDETSQVHGALTQPRSPVDTDHEKLVLTNASLYRRSQMADIDLPVSWLWHGYVARTQMTLLTGQWKLGKTTVKVYRLEHQTLDVGEFTGVTQPEGKPIDPYHPATYRPYFLGEFGWKPDPDHPGVPRVELLNPQEPMLYWLVPVIPRPEGSPPGPDGKDYIDFLSQHAGVPPGQEFPWGQLR